MILGSLALIQFPLAHALPPNVCIWDGTNNNWESTADWTCSTGSTHRLPTSADEVDINSGTVTVTANENFGNMFLDGGNLIVNCGVTLTGAEDINNDGGGTVTNKGTITLGEDLNNDAAGTVTNLGTLTVSEDINNQNGGTVTNSGTLAIQQDLNNGPGTFTNRGTVTIGEDINNAAGTLTNSGTITVSLAINNGSGTFNNCGTVNNSGSFSGNAIVTVPSGCLGPTPPPACPGAAIPEYPLGLPLLAILTIIGYGMIRRRITKK